MRLFRFHILPRCALVVCAALGCGLGPLPAQDPAATALSPAPAAGQPKSDQAKALATMRALKSAIADAEAELEGRRAALRDAATAGEQDGIGMEIQVLNERLAMLRADIEGVAVGIDLKAFTERKDADVNLGAEMQDFLQPIVTQLKEMTSRPREIEEVKNNISYYTKRKQLAAKAQQHLADLLSAAENPAVIAELETLQKTWRQRFEQAENNLAIVQFQLESKRAEKGTMIHSISEAASGFFRTRGRNLLIAVVAFLVVFTMLRLIHQYIHRLSPMRTRGHRSIAVRIVDITYYVFTFVASTGVVLFVLYVTDDWVLLGLALLVLAGLAWAGKHTLPLFYEQAKLMLNLGSVREGERVLYGGVPWRVEAINIFTDLTNPLLQGGRLRLPLRELVPLISRPFGSKEPWFACEEGDWVLLSDETFGKVVAQTPEWVQIVKLGGSRKTFTTADFIALNPENLSRNFRVRIVFGVDYQHQAICTTEIPKILRHKLKAALGEFVGEKNLHNLAVEFREAGASSLDYEVLADFEGAAASKYNKIQRLIPRLCVDACNENHWVIPFTQITLHQAPPAKRGKAPDATHSVE